MNALSLVRKKKEFLNSNNIRIIKKKNEREGRK